MKDEYFRIRDHCRKGLLKYLAKAFSIVPELERPAILDIGCGTGVPTLWLAENCTGTITAVDIDRESIEWLRKKISVRKFENRINALNLSFSDVGSAFAPFDIILAEGFLNVVGFGKGFPKLIGMLKKGGHFIVHDEYRDHERKCDFIRKQGCELLHSFVLDEKVWWRDYYKLLETEINAVKIKGIRDLFKNDRKEIELYKRDPVPFRSAYYIVKKG